MKKFLGIALTLILSLCLICVVAVSAIDSPLTFTVGEASGIAGQDVSVNVNVSNNTGFGVLQLEVKFDHTKLQLVSFKKNIELPDDYSDIGVNGTVAKANTSGSIKVKWEPDLIEEGVFSTPVTFEGNALTLKFTILDTNAVGTEIPVTVAVKDCYIDDFDMTDVEYTTVNGKVTVIACDHAGNTNELTETTAANCTTPGEKTGTCSVCGGALSEPIPVVADAHNFGEWNEVVPGTCTTPAKLERVCSHNAAHKETKDGAIVADKHSFGEWTEVTPGNCTTPAKLERVCANDASHKETKDGDIVADAHSFGDWTVTVEPTSTTEGEMTRACNHNPAHVETVVLEKLGLTYESDDKTITITPDDNSFVPKNSKLEMYDVSDLVDDAYMKDVEEYVKKKTGKELAVYYTYGFVDEKEMAIQINKATMTITVPTADNFENLKYYIVSLDDSGLIDVTDKVVDGVLTYEAEEFGIVNLIVAGDKVVVEEDEDLKPEVKPEEKPEDKNPQNGDNAAIPFVLVATMLAAAAVMVIFKKKVNA